MAIGTGTALALSAGIGAATSIGGSMMSSSAAGKAGEAADEASAQNNALIADLINNGTDTLWKQRAAAIDQTQNARTDTYNALVSGLGRTDAAMGYWDSAIGTARGDLANALAEWDAKYNTVRTDNTPYMNLGYQGVKGYSDLLTNPDSITNDPGYQFRLSQGQNALDNSASARGRLLSGAQAKAMTEYGQNFATAEYDNALARYNTATNQGQTSQARVDSAGMTTAAGKAQVYGNLANVAMNGAAGKTGVAEFQANQYQNAGNVLANTDLTAANIEQQTGRDITGLWTTAIKGAQQNNTDAAQARGTSYINQANATNKGLEGVGNAVNSGVNNYLTMDYLNNRSLAPSSSALGIISRY